jgi:rhodanese-related sulfurtransferase
MKRSVKWIGIFVVLVLAIFASSLCALAQDIPQVKPEELKKMIESGDQAIVIVDTQPKGAYDLGHVKGAINFPWASTLKSNGNLPKDKTLILYCDCAHEEDSTDVATQLMEKWGYTNIKLLEGGWSNWLKLGYPMEKNK